MSGDGLKVDTPTLTAAGHNLRIVAQEFDHASDNARRASGAVGHHGLADAIDTFESNWSGKRKQMLEHMGSLADQCTGVGEEFERLDSEFARTLRGEKK